MLTNLITLATATTEAGAEATTTGTIFSLIVPLALMLIIFYFFLIRPQKKKEKETKNMRDSLQIGDEVTTIGGITGIVVRKSEDSVVIETGGEKNKIRVKTWAISENATSHDDVEEAKESKKKKID